MSCNIKAGHIIEGIGKYLKDGDNATANKLQNALRDTTNLSTHFTIDFKSKSKLDDYSKEYDSNSNNLTTTELHINNSISNFIEKAVDLIPSVDKTLPSIEGEISQGWQSVISYFIRPETIKSTDKYGTTKEKIITRLDPDVQRAVSLVTSEWLNNDALTGISELRGDDGVRALLGMGTKDIVTKTERDAVRDIDGYVGEAARQMGNKIYSMLGIRAKANSPQINNKLIENTLKVELGLLALKTLEYNGDISLSKKDIILNEEVIRSQVSVYQFNNKHNNNINLNTPNGVLPLSINDKYNDIKFSKIFTDKVNEVINNKRIAGIYTDPKEAIPSYDEIKNNGVTGILGNIVSEAHKNAVQNSSSTAYEFKHGFIKGVEYVEKALKKAMGYKDEAKTTKGLREATRGKNLAIDMQYDNLMNAYNTVGLSKKMYAKWEVITNNRFMIDSNQLNWQDKKMHRQSVFFEPVVVTEENKNDFYMMLGQSFDLDIDKHSPDVVNKAVEDLFKDIEKNTKLSVTKRTKKSLDSYYNSKDYKKDIETLFKYIVDNYNSSEPEHALSGAVELLGWMHETKASRPYTTQSMIETDAITSGYAIKGLMFPFHDNKEEINWSEFERTGIFTADAEITDYGEWKDNEDNKDSYEVPAEMLTEKLQALYTEDNTKEISDIIKLIDKKAKFDKDGELVSISRNFMKNPFMVLNYGSAIKSIIRAVSKHAEDEFYQTLDALFNSKENSNRKELQTSVLNAIATIAKRMNPIFDVDGEIIGFDRTKANSTYKSIINRFKHEGLEFELTSQEATALRESISDFIGEPLTKTFKEKYGRFIELTTTINESMVAQFRIANEVIEKEIEKLHQEKLKDASGNEKLVTPMTDKEYQEIVQSVANILPVVNTALDLVEGGKAPLLIAELKAIDNREVWGNTSTSGYVRSKFTKNTKESDVYINSAPAQVKRLLEAYSSGSVIPIHFFDGSIQAKLLAKLKALGVHDANFSPINMTIEVTKAYNEIFWELAREYSLAKEIRESYLNSLTALDDDIVTALNSKYSETLKDSSKIPYTKTLSKLNKQLENVHIEAENKREKIFTTPVVVNQAYYNNGTESAAYIPNKNEYTKQTIDEDLVNNAADKLKRYNNISLENNADIPTDMTQTQALISDKDAKIAINNVIENNNKEC